MSAETRLSFPQEMAEELLKADDVVRADKAKQLSDLALLSQGLLNGEELNKFIERSIELV